MDFLKDAAIIILGMGESCAAEILKNLSQKEVEAIIETMNNMGDVSEQEVIKALNEFFYEASYTAGLHISSDKFIRKTFFNAVGSDKADGIFGEVECLGDLEGFELLKWQPPHLIVDALQEEHPQIITVVLMYLDSEKSAQILKCFPMGLSQEVIHRMTDVSPVSSYAMTLLSEYLYEQFTQVEKFKVMNADGIDKVANIISCMSNKEEQEIINFLNKKNLAAAKKIQEKLFPFERLSQLDSKSLHALVQETDNDDLVLALKGSSELVQKAFFKNMSTRTVALLKDDMEALGVRKIGDLIQAQQKIIDLAKRLAEEQKIVLPGAKNAIL